MMLCTLSSSSSISVRCGLVSRRASQTALRTPFIVLMAYFRFPTLVLTLARMILALLLPTTLLFLLASLLPPLLQRPSRSPLFLPLLQFISLDTPLELLLDMRAQPYCWAQLELVRRRRSHWDISPALLTGTPNQGVSSRVEALFVMGAALFWVFGVGAGVRRLW